jgi:hypothetical protein
VLLSSEHSALFLGVDDGYCPNTTAQAHSDESQRALLYYTTSKAIDDKTTATKQEKGNVEMKLKRDDTKGRKETRDRSPKSKLGFSDNPDDDPDSSSCSSSALYPFCRDRRQPRPRPQLLHSSMSIIIHAHPPVLPLHVVPVPKRLIVCCATWSLFCLTGRR